jgi:hypothetical protein
VRGGELRGYTRPSRRLGQLDATTVARLDGALRAALDL